jgi:hypothetical protein
MGWFHVLIMFSLATGFSCRLLGCFLRWIEGGDGAASLNGGAGRRHGESYSDVILRLAQIKAPEGVSPGA